MKAQLFLAGSEELALGLLAVAVILALIRLLRGPALADRIVALDMLGMLAISLIGVLTLRLGQPLLLDIAVALCLVGFVSTIFLARLLLLRGKSPDEPPIAGQPGRSGE